MMSSLTPLSSEVHVNLTSTSNTSNGTTANTGTTTPSCTTTTTSSEEGESSSSSTIIPPLNILICTGNLGNAQPNEESIKALIPKDGSINEVVKKTKYPINKDSLVCGVSNNSSSSASAAATVKEEVLLDFGTEDDETKPSSAEEEESLSGGYFDLIVIGMQEANFNTLKKKGKKKKNKQSKKEKKSSLHSIDENPILENIEQDDDDNNDYGYNDDYDDDDDSSSISSTNSAPDDLESEMINPDPIKQPYAFDLLALQGNSVKGLDEETKQESEEFKKIKKEKRRQTTTRRILKKAISKRIINQKLSKGAGVVQENVVMPIVQTMYSCDHTKTINNLHSSLYTKNNSILNGHKANMNIVPPSATIILANMMKNQCPSYNCLVNFQRGEMRLIVLVRKGRVEKEVKDVECDAVNTGIGNVLANKGGITATFTLQKTRFTFLSAHLEAHEGEAHFLGRCNNIAEIIAGSRNGPGTLYDASITSHHMFVCGDLNYRVSLGRWGLLKEEHKEEVHRLTKEKRWEYLNEVDELRRALDEKRCLVGFETLPCHFPPTFKVERKKGFVYQEKRSPSYTDRILWKSAHGLGEHVQPLAYEPISAFSTSDHKPVRGAFSITPNAPLSEPEYSERHAAMTKAKSQRASIRLRDLHFMVSSMKCTSLAVGSRTPNPYILLVTDPPEMLKQEKPNNGIKILTGTALKTIQTESATKNIKYRTWKGWPRSSSIENTYHPDWEGEAIKCTIQNLPDPESDDNASQFLAGAMLYITIMNDEKATADTVIGTVALNLEKLLSGNLMGNSTVHEPILRDGKVKGMLECSIMTVWMSLRGLC